MTNHVHVIMQSKNGDLSGLVRNFKKFTSKRILKEVHANKQESRKECLPAEVSSKAGLEMVFEYHAKYNKRVKSIQLWTHENHAVELSSNDIIDSRVDYLPRRPGIHENPARAGWVEKLEDYVYSSARNYSGLSILLENDFI